MDKGQEAEKSQVPPENPPPYHYGNPQVAAGVPPPAYPAQPSPYPQQAYPQQPYAPMGQQQPQTTQPGHTTNVVYVAPPAPLANPPSDYLCFNIFVTICCCWPVGIFAILKSVETREAINRGDQPRASSASKQAKKFGVISLVLGIMIAVISIVFVGVYIGVVLSSLHDTGDYDK